MEINRTDCLKPLCGRLQVTCWLKTQNIKKHIPNEQLDIDSAISAVAFQNKAFRRGNLIFGYLKAKQQHVHADEPVMSCSQES